MADEITENGGSPELMERAQLGNLSQAVLDAIGAWLQQHEKNLINEVMKKIDYKDGKLDPDVALHACFAIHAARKLHSHLEKRIRQGAQAASKLRKVDAT